MDYLPTLLLLVGLLVFVYKLFSTRDMREPGLLLIFLAAAYLIFLHEGIVSDSLLSGVIIFNAILASYGKRLGILYILAGIFFIFVTLGTSAPLVLQAAVIGALSATVPYARPNLGKAKMRVERPRNIFQIVSGVFLILLFIFIRTAISETLLLSLFLVGIILLDYAIRNPNSRLSGRLSSMERQGFYMGYGAVWLGMGALFAAAFLGPTLAIPIFAAIFIGDSFSTLIGVRYGHIKLPYNNKKSIAGSLAYFVPVLIISYFIVGYWALPLAALAAFVESLPLPMDDNFSVSLLLTTIIAIVV